MAGPSLRRRLLGLAGHSDAARELELILDDNAWPAAAEVGEDGCAAALAVALAATARPAFQRRCLVMIKDAVRHGEVPPDHAERLERVLAR